MPVRSDEVLKKCLAIPKNRLPRSTLFEDVVLKRFGGSQVLPMSGFTRPHNCMLGISFSSLSQMSLLLLLLLDVKTMNSQPQIINKINTNIINNCKYNYKYNQYNRTI